MPLPAATFDYEEALLACARGESYALRALFDRESRRLLGVALRIVRDRQTAEDVVQEAFLQIWRRAETYQPALGSARGWIYTVVRHQALDWVRRVRHDVPMDTETMQAVAESHSLAVWRDDGDGLAAHADALRPCLDALEPKQRESIVYAFVEGYTHTQTAERLRAPLGTVKSWIRRGLLALKECLA